MSNARATKRPNGKPAPAKARQAPPTSARAAPEKITKEVKNRTEKWIPPRAGMGRPKGSLNKVTRDMQEMIKAFLQGNFELMQSLWLKVARTNPAKAVGLYTKIMEFGVPKLQRTELSGQLDHTVKEVPAYEDLSPEEAMRIYMETVHSTNATFMHLPSVKPYVAPSRPEIAAPLRPAQEFIAAPERPSRHESAPHTAEAAEPETNETNVAVILPRHEGEHRPIVDSKCGFCRKLWVEAQKASQDEALRAQRPPRVVT